MKITSLLLLFLLSISASDAADWTLKWNSPAVNAGTDLASIGVTTDIIGFARPTGANVVDLGAYELPFYTTSITFNAKGSVSNYTSGDVISNPKGRDNLTYTITPNQNCKITSVLYNGINVTSNLVGNVFAAPALTSNSTLTVQFESLTGLEDNLIMYKCYSIDKKIRVEGILNGDLVQIYNITGKLISNEKATNSFLSVSVPIGVYIVHISTSVFKVVVQ